MQEKKDEFPHSLCKTLVTFEPKQSCLYATNLGWPDRVSVFETHQLQLSANYACGRYTQPCFMADSR